MLIDKAITRGKLPLHTLIFLRPAGFLQNPVSALKVLPVNIRRFLKRKGALQEVRYITFDI